MVRSAFAYSRGMLVKPTWDSKGINFQATDTELKLPDTNEPKLIWDMRGIMRYRPDPGQKITDDKPATPVTPFACLMN